MAIVLTSLPPVFPVYNSSLILNASHSGATNTHYFRFDVYLDSVLIDTFNYPCHPLDFDATIDLSTVLSTGFVSSVYTPSGTTVCELVPDSVKPYYVVANLYTSGDTYVASASTPTCYVFNGSFNTEDGFDMKDFIMYTNTTKKGRFLTNYSTNRVVMTGDTAFLSVLLGSYGTNYNVITSGFKFRSYSSTGLQQTYNVMYSDSPKSILNLNISPSVLNSESAGFIDSDTIYYTIDEFSGRNSIQMRVDILKEYKLKKYYNFVYMNRLGGMDNFTAVKVSADEYSYKKDTLDQFTIQKQFYQQTERSTVVMTQFLSAYQAEKLQELFESPAVRLYFNNTWNSVRIINKKLVVPDRYPKDRFIQYEIEFQYNNKYYNQQY